MRAQRRRRDSPAIGTPLVLERIRRGRTNSRFQKNPGLTAADVPNLKLKWAFGFPGGAQAYGNPAIVAGRVFVGSDSGNFYSIDGDTGCTHWSFQADAGIRSAPTVAPLGTGASARHVVYFGDLKANTYAHRRRDW